MAHRRDPAALRHSMLKLLPKQAPCRWGSWVTTEHAISRARCTPRSSSAPADLTADSNYLAIVSRTMVTLAWQACGRSSG